MTKQNIFIIFDRYCNCAMICGVMFKSWRTVLVYLYFCIYSTATVSKAYHVF